MTLQETLDLKIVDIPHGPVIFLIIMLSALVLPWCSDAYYQIRKKFFKKMTRKEQEKWVEQVHFDLFNRLLNMRDDPFMSDQKWREWLSICRYADEILRIIFPKTKLMNLADFIYRILDEPDEVRA